MSYMRKLMKSLPLSDEESSPVTIRSRVLPFVLLGLLSVPQPASPQEPATLLILPSLVLDGLQLAVSDAQLAIDSHRPLTLQASAYCATDTASELVVLLSAPRSPKGDVQDQRRKFHAF